MPRLSDCWSSLCVNLHGPQVLVNVRLGVKARTLLEWLGRGSRESWSWCWRAPNWYFYIVYCNLCRYDFVRGSYFLVVFKSRDITLPTKVPIVKAMVFPVAMYGCESWTIKKAER